MKGLLMKKGKHIVKLCILLLVIVLAVVIFINGLPLSKIAGVYDIKPIKDLINYGLDLTGGVYVVLQADESETEVTDDTLDKAIAIIRTRIDSLGLKEPEITKQGQNRIRVSIPNVENEQEALDMIGQTAELTFVGPDGEVILTGSNVESSTYDTYYNEYNVGSPAVKITFDTEGTQLFAEATAKYIGQIITIKLDDEEISTPTVNSVISAGEAYITNIGDKETAMNLAVLIRAGALPVDFEVVQAQSIGPSLGQNSLQSGIKGGIIGVVLVLIFMLIFYRAQGIAADIALSIYIVLFLYIMALLGVTLTLPGIAGIVLSIGMAVDANVIIFERIKEELKLGKSPMAAINSGFSRAFVTVLDANVTTIIAGAALFLFGSGTIRGFALTLIIGVLVSMFTAVFITKRLVTAIVDLFGGQVLTGRIKEAK